VPLLLVGPGTGCAPFRAFIEERVAIMKSSEPVISPIMFFFGCRHKEQDFLYKEFWIAQTEECGLLSRGLGGGLFLAFSRDQPQKVYVQHKIKEHSEDVWRMLQLGCSVYIAGSAHEMPLDVGEALEGVIAKEGYLSKDDAKKWLKQLERSGRYHVEAWQ
jgi:sulfite reductase alpha subunit-like flavoprotein